MPGDTNSAILCFDFDGTLVDKPSDPYEIARLEEFITHMQKRGAAWGINTGRTLYHTLDGLKEHGFRLTPDFIVARECEIYHLNEYNRWVDLGDWNRRCAADHKRFYKAHSKFFKRLSKHIATEVRGARFISDETEPAGIYTNDNSRTRVGFRGKAKINGDLEAGYRLEIGVRTQNSKRFNQNDPSANSTGIGANTSGPESAFGTEVNQ